jgi:hypothetical protein
MKAFSDGKLSDRQISRRNDQQAPDKEIVGIECPVWNPEDLHQTQALIQDLDKQFARLREMLQARQVRLSQVKRAVSGLQTFLFPSRRPWWRRWLPW